MMLDAPFYLQVGSLILEDGTGSGPYNVTSMSFPEPSPDGVGGYFNAKRVITVTVNGTSASDLSANVAALRRECVRDELLYFRPSATGDVLSCKIRQASVSEASTNPLRRAQMKADLTVTLETEPKWAGSWSAEVDVSSSLTSIPGHFDVTGVTGEEDADFSLRIVPTREGRGLAIGIKPDPAAGYDYLDDYSGTTDANALTTGKAGLAATTTPTAVGTAPNIDTNANRGRHLPIVRMDTTATTAANNTAKVRVTTTGNAIAAATSVDEPAVPFAALDLCGMELGANVSVPAGAVPDITTGSGWGASGALASHATTNGYDRIGFYGGGSYQDARGTTFTLAAASLVESFTFYLSSDANRTMTLHCWLANQSGGFPSSAMVGVQQDVSLTTTLTAVTFTINPTQLAAGVYSVGVYDTFHLGADVRFASDTGLGYAGGAQWTRQDLVYYADTDSDLKFIVTGRQQLGFNTTMPILATCSESSKTVALDYVQRIPVDFAAIVYRPAAPGSLGLYYDSETDTPYIADADGIGPAVYDKCEIRAPLRLKPGVTNRVVVGILQNDEVVAGVAAAVYKWRPRFLTATG